MNRTTSPPCRRVWSKIPLAVACIGAGILGATPAESQTMDYGSLEKLFGEPVTTSATGSPQRATRVPVTMEIITAAQIRRSGAYDVSGVLRHVSGIEISRWTNDQTDLNIRGYNQALSPRLLVLIDGRQVYSDHYGFTAWSTLPVELSAIRQIEVVKGPNTALYGFNAVSGVINIVTYDPQYDDINAVALRAGTQDLAQASAVKTIKMGDVAAFRISAGYRSNDDFSTPIPPSVASSAERPGSERKSIDLVGVVALDWNLNLRLEANHTEAKQNDVSPDYSLLNDRFRTSAIKGQLTADTSLGIVQLTGYTNWLIQDANPNFHFSNRISVVQLENVFRAGDDHTIRLSAEYRHNTVRTSPTTGGKVFYDIYSAGAMWDWRITSSVSLTNAVRVDQLQLGRSGSTPAGYPFTNADWDRSITELSVNSGVVWKADEDNVLRLTFGRGAQLPSLTNFGGVLVNAGFDFTGTPTVDPTSVTGYEIAWDSTLASLGLKLRTALFHQESQDLVSIVGGLVFGPGPPYVTPAQIGDSSANGLEIGVTGEGLENWRWGVNYRFQLIDDEFLPFASGGIDFVDYEHTTARHVANATLGWSKGNWEIDGFIHLQSDAFGLERLPLGGTQIVPLSAYASVDARVAYDLTEWATVSISAQNMLQSEQKQTSGPEVERRIFGTLAVNF